MAKVWKVPSNSISYLPIPAKVYEPREFYTLYRKFDGRWNRIRTQSHNAATAVKVWGHYVVLHPETYSIRVSKLSLNEAK